MGNFKAIWMSFKICTIFILIALIKLLFSGYALHIFLHNFCFTFIDQTIIKNICYLFFVELELHLTWIWCRGEQETNEMFYRYICRYRYILRVPLCQVNFNHLSLCRSPSSSRFCFLYSFCFTYWLQISQFNIYGISWFASIAISKFQIAFHKQLNSLV